MCEGNGIGGMVGVVRYIVVALWNLLGLLLVVVVVECGWVMMIAGVGRVRLHIVLLVMDLVIFRFTNLTHGSVGITNGDV